MTTKWHYQIIKYSDGSFGLHEVNNLDGKFGLTADPIAFVCNDYEGPDGIIESLEMALAHVKRYPVREVPEMELPPFSIRCVSLDEI